MENTIEVVTSEMQLVRKSRCGSKPALTGAVIVALNWILR
jgi:hypothetical protein